MGGKFHSSFENGENGRTSVQFFRRSVTSAGIRRNALCNRMQS